MSSHLQRLAALREEAPSPRRLRLPHPHERQVARGNLAHPLLDALEILGHERALDDEVVEEALVGGRADAALRPGKELEHRRREQVGGAVAGERQRFRDPSP